MQFWFQQYRYDIHKCIYKLINFLFAISILSVSIVLNIWNTNWEACIHVYRTFSFKYSGDNSWIILHERLVIKRLQLIWIIFIKRCTVSFTKLGVFLSVRRFIYILPLEKVRRNKCWKVSDSFRNLVIIMSVLRYRFIHSTNFWF